MIQNFIRNNYPASLVDTKINEIVSRNFEKSDFRKSQILKQKQNTHENSHILKIPFTSFRISPIIAKIKKLINNFIPNFNLRIVHSTISIKNLINFHIKPSIDPLATSNVVYRFEIMWMRLIIHRWNPTMFKKPYLATSISWLAHWKTYY